MVEELLHYIYVIPRKHEGMFLGTDGDRTSCTHVYIPRLQKNLNRRCHSTCWMCMHSYLPVSIVKNT